MKKIRYKIDNKGYGKYNGFTIDFHGFDSLPRYFAPRGFKAGKYLLEALGDSLGKFSLHIDKKKKSSVRKKPNKTIVNLNFKDCLSFRAAFIGNYRREGVKTIARHLAGLFPDYFEDKTSEEYRKGTIATAIPENITLKSFSKRDITKLLRTSRLLKDYEIVNKKELAELHETKNVLHYVHLDNTIKTFREMLSGRHSESKWQSYLRDNLTVLNPSYVGRIEKRNIRVGNTGFPDFILISVDNYVDVYEIKTPEAPLMRWDRSHKNYYWSEEIAKTISQIENYLCDIDKQADSLIVYLRDKQNIEARIIRPRGIVLAGKKEEFYNGGKLDKKMMDDFRLLNNALKNIEIVCYDEYLMRYENLSKMLKQEGK